MRRLFRVLFVAVLFTLVAVPFAGAVTWQFQHMQMFPQFTSDASATVLVANVSDSEGKPINPDRCLQSANDDINIVWRYPAMSEADRMDYVNGTTSWWYNHTLRPQRDQVNITLQAGGTCNDVSPDDPVRKNVSFRPDGNLSINTLTDLSGEHGEGDTISVRWNATNDSDMHGEDNGFEPGANLSYRLYTVDGRVNRSGSVQDGSITVNQDHFAADITLPEHGGLYILAVNASNTSMNFQHPFGGAAVPVDVVSKLRGNVVVNRTDVHCRAGDPLFCEKGGVVEVWFHERLETPERVEVTVRNGSDTYTTMDLSRWNDTAWNGSFHLSADLATDTYGHKLLVEANASDQFSQFMDTTLVNVSRFRVFESTQAFVQVGSVINLYAGPVTPFTEVPIAEGNMSTVEFSVKNSNGVFVYNDTLNAPFSDDAYDENAQMFVTEYAVPQDAPTGTYTVETVQTDVYGVTQTTSFTFTVLDSDSAETSIVIQSVNGTDRMKLTPVFTGPGNHTATVTLNNSADVAAKLNVSVSGNLTNRSTVSPGDPVQFAAGEVKTATFNFSLPKTGFYDGDITFHVYGDAVVAYNTTLPTNLSVTPLPEEPSTPSCAFRNGSLCVSPTLIDAEVTTEGNHSIQLTLWNEEETNVTLTPQGNISTLLTARNVSLAAATTEQANMTFTATADDDGYYAGVVRVASGTAQVDVPVQLVVDAGTEQQTAFTVSPDITDLGTFVTGEPLAVSITITNTGSTTISSLSVSAPQLGISAQRSVTLTPGESQSMQMEGTAPGFSGDTTATITVTTSTDVSNTTTVSVTTVRNYTADFNRYTADVERYRGVLQNASGNHPGIRENVSALETAIQDGKAAMDAGNYDTAERHFDRAQQIQQSLGPAINEIQRTTEEERGGGANIPVVPIVVALVILLVIGVILYLSLVPEEEGDMDFSRPPPRR